jgi:hypothetical protein
VEEELSDEVGDEGADFVEVEVGFLLFGERDELLSFHKLYYCF